MSTLRRLLLNLIQGLRNGCSRLNRWTEEHYDLIETEAVAVNGPPDNWTEEHYDLIETEAVAVNGPPDNWTYPKNIMPSSHT